jgi:Ca2+-binding EF-hand superfamily protein
MDQVPAYLRDSFTTKQLQEHHELFASFDTDGGGTIDAVEMTELARTLGLKINLDGAKTLIEGKSKQHLHSDQSNTHLAHLAHLDC